MTDGTYQGNARDLLPAGFVWAPWSYEALLEAQLAIEIYRDRVPRLYQRAVCWEDFIRARLRAQEGERGSSALAYGMQLYLTSDGIATARRAVGVTP